MVEGQLVKSCDCLGYPSFLALLEAEITINHCSG